MNWKTRTGSCRSPARTRLRPLPRYRAPAAAAGPRAATGRVRRAHLIGRQAAVGASPDITLGLFDPVPDRLGRRLELASEIRRAATGPNQLDQLVPELRRIGRMRSPHG